MKGLCEGRSLAPRQPKLRIVREREGSVDAVDVGVGFDGMDFFAGPQRAVQGLHDVSHHSAVGRIAEEDQLGQEKKSEN